jgi:hypothetical protein
MFSSANQATTSLPDMTADLSQQFSVDISKEGLHKKFSAEGVVFLKELLKVQLSQQVSLQEHTDLKRHFTAINIKDSSKFSLPDIYNGAYPSFGNFSKTNGLMNLQYEYDLMSGKWIVLELTSVKRNDQQDSKQTIDSLKQGGLYIRDLGYITPTYLKAVVERGAYFLNRLPPQANIYNCENKPMGWKQVTRKFKKAGMRTLDMEVLIYQRELLKCRLVIEMVTDDEYRNRLRQAECSAKKNTVWGCPKSTNSDVATMLSSPMWIEKYYP